MDPQLSSLHEILLSSDPSLKAIFTTDIRNLFPKYQLSKIESIRNTIAKTHLIMKHLNEFLRVQIYRKSMKDAAKNIPQANMEHREEDSHQMMSMIDHRQTIKQLCASLNKGKIEEKVVESLEKSQKWRKYIQEHQGRNKLNLEKGKEWVELAKQLPLSSVKNEAFLKGAAGKIIEERIEKEKRIKELMVNQQQGWGESESEQRESEQRESEQKSGEQKSGEQKSGEQKSGEQKSGEQKSGEYNQHIHPTPTSTKQV